MKEKIKTQKGFIPIPLLIAIIIGILVIGGSSYFGYTQFKIYQGEQTGKEKQVQDLISSQQADLTKTQELLRKSEQEITKIKTGGEKEKQETGIEILELQGKLSELQEELETEKNKPEIKPEDLSIRASDINPYLTGVVTVYCKDATGSGSLWKNYVTGDYFVLTNQHVVERPFSNGFCFIGVLDRDGNEEGAYLADLNEFDSWNKKTDIAILGIKPLKDSKFFEDDNIIIGPSLTEWAKPIEDLNYEISSLPACSYKMPVGSPVVLIGFPAFAYVQTGPNSHDFYRATTDGIISTYDQRPHTYNLPEFDYFTSAKIDAGNSGGVAFSKDENGLCVLGVPTWLTVGRYETQGIIQNIHNIMYTNP